MDRCWVEYCAVLVVCLFAALTPLAAKFLLFLRTLSASPDVREHTRALSLADVQASVYSRLPPHWLSHVFQRLPNLGSFAVCAFPFFDHASLLDVGPHPQAHNVLHTLSATGCANTTARALSQLLVRLPALVVLDLSGTSGAAHTDVLAAVAALSRLRCLAMRRLRIDDGALAPLVRGLGMQLWKLDLGGNLLTDEAVGLLLDWSFAPPEYYTRTSTCAEGEEEEEEELSPPSSADGLAHLRIAANRISAVGVQRLLKSTRLETLDVGAAGVAGVVAALAVYAWRNLKTLRVDSQIVFQNTAAWPSRASALRNLVLCAVPVAGSRRFADALIALLEALQGTAVEVLELEMVTETAELYASSASSGARADFSFFSGDPQEGEGGSSWTGEGRDEEAEVDVVERVAAYRKRCRATGSGWAGKVRVVKDLGERASIERAIGGEEWAV